MNPSALSYAIHAHTSRPGAAEVVFSTESIEFDASWASEPSGLPGPAELLAAAFSACLLKNLERASKLLDFRYERAEVDVIARRQDSPPKFVEITYEMRITTAEPPRRVDLVHRNLRKYGTVYNTLAAVCETHGQVMAILPLTTAVET